MAANDVTVRIGGTTMSLTSALSQATADLQRLRTEMTVSADASKVLGEAGRAQGMAWVQAAANVQDYLARLDQLRMVVATVSATQDQGTQAIRMMTEQMQLAQDTTTTLADASRLLGDTYAQQAADFLNAATSAQDYAARLDYLQTQMAGVTAGQDTQAFSMANLSQAFSSGGISLSSLTSLLGDAGGPVTMLASGIDNLVGSVGQFIESSASMIVALVGWQALMDAANYVQQLTDQMFQLNEQTQKTAFSWKYLFGGGQQGWNISRSLMQWTATASLSMPYTRQDIMGAITNLLSIQGMTQGNIEKYLPMLSDLGASRASGLDLQQVVQAIVGAQFGYTRMLRYELHINPQDLVKYGLKMTKSGHLTDPNSLLPALMAYSQAKGYLGAGEDIATNTWWGAWSSFVDRFQNAALELGGLDQSGAASPRSMFGALMKDLVNISQWWDDHQTELKQIEDIAARLVGGAVQGGGGLLGAFFQMIGQTGAVQDVVGWMEQADFFLGQLFGSPATTQQTTTGKHAAGMGATRYLQTKGYNPGAPNQFAEWGQDLAKITEALTGQTAQLLQQVLQDAATMGPQAAAAMGQLGAAWQMMASSVSPQEAQAMKVFAEWMIASFVGSVGVTALVTMNSISAALTFLGATLQQVTPVLQFFENAWQALPGWLKGGQTQIQDTFTALKKDAYGWATDMMDAFEKGIRDKISQVAKVAQQVAAAVRGPLHFSRPDYGPLADYESWMPDMLRTLADGMRAGLPEVSRAAAQASATIAAPLVGYGGGGRSSTSSTSYSNSYSDDSRFSQTFYGASEAYMDHVARRMQDRFNRSANIAARRPGGFPRFGELGPGFGLGR